MTKSIYMFNPSTKQFAGYKDIAETEAVPENATLVAPQADGGGALAQPIIWNGLKWTGRTMADLAKEIQSPVSIPTPEQLMINQLGLRVAKLELQNKEGA